MKIELVCNDGSPLGPNLGTIYGDNRRLGVGGAELALLTMCEELSKRHELVLYNDPWEKYSNSPFEQRRILDFDIKGKRDYLIIFRSPNLRTIPVQGCKKIWWSCDQYTTNSFGAFAPTVDQIVVISPFHAKYFADHYGIKNTIVTDLPVRVNDYKQDIPRIKHKFLFSSVPDRGLESLWRMWPLIQREIPDVTLTITSDYRLWGASTPLNDKYKLRWAAQERYKFIGAVSRMKLVEEQLSSDLLCYPSTYSELFCLAVSEAQVAGAYPITTGIGALPTTNMGTVVMWDAKDARGDALFVQKIKDVLDDPLFDEKRKMLQQKAIERFHPDTIIDYWERNVLT